MREYGINTPERQAAFLAQIGHESGSFAYVREIASGEAYEGRRDLGNTHQGDGVRFAGKGLIQLTGRANYRDMTRWLGWSDCPDFEAHPDELAAPRWAALSACAYWASRDLNALADAGDFEGITRKINGGLNGHADRVVRLQRARQALAGQIDVGAPITTAPIPAQPPAPAAPPAAEVDTSRGRVQKPPKTEHIPAGESGDAPENSMPPFIAAGLSALIQHAPALIRVFGDSPQAEKNAKAAEVVAGIAQQVTGQPTVEGAIQAAEEIVRLAQAVQADAHVVEAHGGDAVGHGLVDQGAVGRQARVELHVPGAFGDLEDVGPHQRLAAREDQHRHPVGLEVVHHAEHFLRGQLALVVVVGRQRVAVLAGQVAAADQVPDHHRPRRLAAAPAGGNGVGARGLGLRELAHVLADAEHG